MNTNLERTIYEAIAFGVYSILLIAVSFWVGRFGIFPSFQYEPTENKNATFIIWESDHKKVEEITKEHGEDVVAMAEYNNGVCIIYAKEPESKLDLFVIGHEFLHCYRGSYHE